MYFKIINLTQYCGYMTLQVRLHIVVNEQSKQDTLRSSIIMQITYTERYFILVA